MNKCLKCNVDIYTSTPICPICQNPIKLEKDNSLFPKIKSKYKFHKELLYISLLTSFLGIIISTILNLLISHELSWCIIVDLGITSFWLTFINGINKRKKIMKLLFTEIILITILSVFWDYYTGFHKWSIIYVLPFLCIAYTITFLILRIFTNKVNKDIIIYTYINALIGLIPLYFILKKSFKTLWPSYFSVITSIIALIFLFVFNYKTLENELARRLHI